MLKTAKHESVVSTVSGPAQVAYTRGINGTIVALGYTRQFQDAGISQALHWLPSFSPHAYRGNMTPKDQFDPLGGVLRPAFPRPAELSPLNLRVLSPFQRALLVIDGTVTKFIEAYTMEPVDVVRLRQGPSSESADHLPLELVAGCEVTSREVIIRGRFSDTLYVYAVSYIVLSRVPPEIRKRLEIQGESLGRILEDQSLETRREILWFGRERLEWVPELTGGGEEPEFVSRAYRIIAGERPIALISERFPIALQRLSVHH